MTKAKQVRAILNRWKKDISKDTNKPSFGTIERVFGLPQRTLEGWRSGKVKPDEGALPLLRIIDTFPWLIRAANADYDAEKSNKFLAIAGLDAMRDKLEQELRS